MSIANLLTNSKMRRKLDGQLQYGFYERLQSDTFARVMETWNQVNQLKLNIQYSVELLAHRDFFVISLSSPLLERDDIVRLIQTYSNGVIPPDQDEILPQARPLSADEAIADPRCLHQALPPPRPVRQEEDPFYSALFAESQQQPAPSPAAYVPSYAVCQPSAKNSSFSHFSSRSSPACMQAAGPVNQQAGAIPPSAASSASSQQTWSSRPTPQPAPMRSSYLLPPAQERRVLFGGPMPSVPEGLEDPGSDSDSVTSQSSSHRRRSPADDPLYAHAAQPRVITSLGASSHSPRRPGGLRPEKFSEPPQLPLPPAASDPQVGITTAVTVVNIFSASGSGKNTSTPNRVARSLPKLAASQRTKRAADDSSRTGSPDGKRRTCLSQEKNAPLSIIIHNWPG